MTQGRVAQEKATLELMVHYYCRKVHKTPELCGDCRAQLDYSLRRLDACRHGDAKGACSDCPTPCYEAASRERIRRIMRWAGPRMAFLSPGDFFKHLFRRRRRKES